MSESKPLSLYKYLPHHLDRIGGVFVRRKARFTNPVKFNDPFDCMQRIRFPDPDNVSAADESLLREYVDHIHKDGGGLVTTTGQQITPKIAFANGLHKNKQFIESMPEAIHKYTQQEARRIGVFCLSERPISVSMWAHYASNHRGLVVEFDHSKLCNDEGEIHSFAVNYSSELPTLADYMKAVNSKDATEFWQLFFCRKSNEWQAEEE